MHANEALIDKFYSAFAQRDHQTMAACYSPGATFGDPVFPDLSGPEVGAMWRMLCERGTDLEVSHRNVRADDGRGSADWEATYTFTATGRKVHNRIHAEFVFSDGKIAEHRDHFEFHRWSRMALGPIGVVLGWTPFVRKRVREKADRQLRKFMESNR
ncbi:MAG TPA: nuclear transport factor 2 family protein [Actinomycetota bacterium]|nr:nuclear transport factor 2 family protein [Actinomycetota bacterium]